MSSRKKSYHFYLVLVCIFLLPAGYIHNLNAEELGRLFLTPEERNRIDRIRYAQPKKEEPIKIVIDETFEEEPEPIPDIGGITVNGLVYRQGGKSTAWINSTNSFEGNLGNQYIEVDSDNIKPGNVRLKIHKIERDVTLKVGETYETTTDKVTDLTDNYTNQ